MINKIKLLDIAALKFAITSIIARIASGLSQLYAIKFFLNNLNANEYSAIILLLGYLPIFFLFEFFYLYNFLPRPACDPRKKLFVGFCISVNSTVGDWHWVVKLDWSGQWIEHFPTWLQLHIAEFEDVIFALRKFLTKEFFREQVFIVSFGFFTW